MNGARAEDCEKTIRNPKSTRKTTKGTNHSFFLTRRNSHSSSRIPSFAIRRPVSHRIPVRRVPCSAGCCISNHQTVTMH